MRRGCLLGCGGWLIACAAIALLGWFVAIPRITQVFEDSVSDGIATVIAEEINPLYSRSQLQQGEDVRFSFSTINQVFQSSTEDEAVDSIRVVSSGSNLVIEVEINDQTFDVAFRPTVTADGRLEFDPVEEGGWWQRQLMGILSNGFESAVNDWLESNDLLLTDAFVDDGDLVMSVIGK